MPLKYLLDTNICIYIAKQKPIAVLEKFESLSVGEVAMSAITYGELLYGANKSQQKKQVLSQLKELSTYIPPMPLSTQVATHYGEARHSLEKKGHPIGNNDLWIAAHAMALGVVLVTNNEKEFRRIPTLSLENWC